MSRTNRPSIVFLSLDHDPSLPSSNPAYSNHRCGVRSLAEALAQVGWQVDIFTRQHQPDLSTTQWLKPHCRIVRLAVNSSLAIAQQIPKFAQAIQSFQIKAGLVSPLFHSFDELSAEVGDYFKRKKGWRWIHSHWDRERFQTELPTFTADQVVLLRSQSSSSEPIMTDEVGQVRHRHRLAQGSITGSWEAIANDLSSLYRQHLAIHVGAIGVNIPKVCDLSELANLASLTQRDFYPVAKSA